MVGEGVDRLLSQFNRGARPFRRGAGQTTRRGDADPFAQRCVENHTRPNAQRGRYSVCTVLRRGETLRLVEFTDVVLAVDDLLR